MYHHYSLHVQNDIILTYIYTYNEHFHIFLFRLSIFGSLCTLRRERGCVCMCIYDQKLYQLFWLRVDPMSFQNWRTFPLLRFVVGTGWFLVRYRRGRMIGRTRKDEELVLISFLGGKRKKREVSSSYVILNLKCSNFIQKSTLGRRRVHLLHKMGWVWICISVGVCDIERYFDLRGRV